MTRKWTLVVAALLIPGLLLLALWRRMSDGAPARGAESRPPDTAVAFVELLVKGDYSNAALKFDRTMKRVMPADKLREVWESLIAQAGVFTRQAGLHEKKLGPYPAVFVTCKFERAMLDVKVVFDRAGRITGLWFVPPETSYEYKPPVYA